MPQREGTGEDAQLREFELILEGSLSPMHPNPEFVKQLRRRLSERAGIILELPDRLGNLLTVMGVITGGLLMMVILARLVYEVLSRVGWIGLPDNEDVQ